MENKKVKKEKRKGEWEEEVEVFQKEQRGEKK